MPLDCSEKELEDRLRKNGLSRQQAKTAISAAKKAEAELAAGGDLDQAMAKTAELFNTAKLKT